MSVKLIDKGILCVFLMGFSILSSQNIRNYTLEISCKSRVYDSTQSILEFKWPYRAPAVKEQRVFKKAKETLAWGTVYKVLNSSDSTFVDTVKTGLAYEYKFERDTGYDGSLLSGYVVAGRLIPAVTKRGKILLIADSTHKSFISNDLRTYRNDLIGDGWFTELKWFSPSTTVNEIKTYIVNQYKADSLNVKSVVLIGNLAVANSGDYHDSGYYPPDGHKEHAGAWSSDYYYACMDNPFWPDSTVNNTKGDWAYNYNVPNDGKFDYTSMDEIKALNTLQVGRIDLHNLPQFTQSEKVLMNQYFIKNHRFKHKIDVFKERCLIDDNFNLFNKDPYWEHFGTNAYRNMAPLIGDSLTYDLDYLTTLDSTDFLWSFGFGSGWHTSISGVATTSDFADTNIQIKSVFSGLWGSHFGDWNQQSDNVLKAPLAAKGNVLNTFWCGRPPYFLHHMGLGETIGYSVLRTQNALDTATNDLLYPIHSYNYLQVHVGLLGDPSVRMQPVYPVRNFAVFYDSCSTRAKLKWDTALDTAVHRFYVFRSKNIDSTFTFLGITDTTVWMDSFPLPEGVYMVRSSKLQKSASGTYINLGQGIFDTLTTLKITKINDTTACLNQTIRLGVTQSPQDHVVYSWEPPENNRDTFSTQISSSTSKILFITDTLSSCVVSDTFSINTLSLPVSETISYVNNSCSDSVTWSSSSNNGSGFIYNWTFQGGSPTDTSGQGLINPGLVFYPNIGNFISTLSVTDTATLCRILDTIAVTVVCASLPLHSAFVSCIDHVNTKEIKFLVLDDEKYNSFQIEGLRMDTWEKLTILPSNNQKAYNYTISNYDLYSEISVFGINTLEELTFIGSCSWDQVKSNYIVAPNPSSKQFNISYTGIQGIGMSRIQVYNQQGQVLLNEYFNFNNKSLTLSLNGYSAGCYLISIQTGDKIELLKIVKTD